jgi:hypothetical protein
MVSATLIGFVLIAAVFYVERFKTFFDSLSHALSGFWRASERFDLDAQQKEISLIKTIAAMESKKDAAKFLSFLAMSLILGFVTILLAISVIFDIPGNNQQLSADEISRISEVVITFVFFLAVTIVIVVWWIYSGLIMATFASGVFESIGEAFEYLPDYRKRIQTRFSTLVKERSEAEEAKLGRKLNKQELLAILESAENRESELGQLLSGIVQEEKEKILKIAGIDARKRKESQTSPRKSP